MQETVFVWVGFSAAPQRPEAGPGVGGFTRGGRLPMDIVTFRAFFGWCTIINAGILIISFLVCATAGDWIYRMHTKWFPISRETFNLAIYSFIGAMKLFVIFLNVVPYVVLVIIS
jgi:hypothetical protein